MIIFLSHPKPESKSSVAQFNEKACNFCCKFPKGDGMLNTTFSTLYKAETFVNLHDLKS